MADTQPTEPVATEPVETEPEVDPVTRDIQETAAAVEKVKDKCDVDGELDKSLKGLCYKTIEEKYIDEISKLDESEESMRTAVDLVNAAYKQLNDPMLVRQLVSYANAKFIGLGDKNEFSRPELVDEIIGVEILDNRGEPPSDAVFYSIVSTMAFVTLLSIVAVFMSDYEVLRGLLVIIPFIYLMHSLLSYKMFDKCGVKLIDEQNPMLTTFTIVAFSILALPIFNTMVSGAIGDRTGFVNNVFKVGFIGVIMSYIMYLFIVTKYYYNCQDYDEEKKEQSPAVEPTERMIMTIVLVGGMGLFALAAIMFGKTSIGERFQRVMHPMGAVAQ